MSLSWDDFLNALVIYSSLPLNMLHLLLFFPLRLSHPLKLALGFFLLFLPLLPMAGLNWDLTPEWKWPLWEIAYIFFTAGVMRYFVLEGSFSSVLFGTLWVLSFGHLVMTFIFAFYFSLFGVTNWGGYHLVIALSYTFFCLVIYPFLHRYFRPYFVRILGTIKSERWYLVNLTPMMLCVLTFMVLFISFTDYNGFIMIVALMLVAAYTGFFFLIYNMALSRDMNSFLEHQLNVSRQFAGMLDHYDEELEKKENSLRVMRHDFRHLLGRLDALALSGDTEAIRNCVSDLFGRSAEYDLGAYSDDRVTNAVISHHFFQAAKTGAKCRAEVTIPENLPLDEAELAVLIGNALENCVKAVSPLGKWGRITVNARPVKDRMVFKFQNNFVEGSYSYGTGLGLRSLKMLCSQHGGSMETMKTNGQFRLTIILPLEPPID